MLGEFSSFSRPHILKGRYHMLTEAFKIVSQAELIVLITSICQVRHYTTLFTPHGSDNRVKESMMGTLKSLIFGDDALCARHCTKHFAYVISFNPQQPTALELCFPVSCLRKVS